MGDHHTADTNIPHHPMRRMVAVLDDENAVQSAVDEKAKVAAALTAAGGHHPAHFGRWIVERQQG